MHVTKQQKELSLKESMRQNWLQNSYNSTYSDQYGFVIHYGKTYRLEFKGKEIVTMYSLTAAQLISTIILNDLVMHKKFE